MSEEWERQAREGLLPKMQNSAVVMSLVPSSGVPDPKIALETGYAVWLNKPIIVVARPGDPIPPGVARIAHSIVQLEHSLSSEEGREELHRALQLLYETIGEGEHRDIPPES